MPVDHEAARKAVARRVKALDRVLASDAPLTVSAADARVLTWPELQARVLAALQEERNLLLGMARSYATSLDHALGEDVASCVGERSDG